MSGASLIAFALVLGSVLPAAPARAADECYYDPVTGRLVCEDEGGGSGGSGATSDYWTSWRIIGDCGGGSGVGGVLIDIFTGLVLAIRDHIVDGETVETQSTCIDLDDAEEAIWEAVASARIGRASCR